MTKEELESIEKRLSKISDDEWEACIEGVNYTSGSSCIIVKNKGIESKVIDFSGVSDDEIIFIANAKVDISKLLFEVKRLSNLQL